ncbi:serine hydrolase domain-containing protein [Pedobacter sp. AW1-32]|uniref:serine hydrolase domain-containing protein n=1 Tax=Pedobacter sp. AW1-32 TaxID=3383026 RepID=UPI003FF04297
MKNCFLTALLLILPCFSFAQQLNVKGLDSLFTALKSNDKFMGTFAIAINGKSVFSRAIGFRDIETKQIASIESKYRIGSISKIFTATLVMKAIEEHKIKLDQTLDTFFPSVKNNEKITITNLLSHRSGIHNLTSLPDFMQWNTQKKSREELVKIIADGGTDFEPGTKYAYSNSNYILLTFILETVYKKSFSELLNAKIIKPLKLTNTYVGSKISLNANEANSYGFDNGWKKETETDMSIPLGAGAIVSNVMDLNTFMFALMENKIVSDTSLKQMEMMTDGYGLGIKSFYYHDKFGFGHTGGIDGFSSILGYFPADKISIAVLSNGNEYSNMKLMLSGLDAVYGKTISIPNFKTIDLKPEDLEPYLGVYAAENFPFKITVSKKDNKLFTQASGQTEIQMAATAKDRFEFSASGIVLEFKPNEKTMILNQSGKSFTLKKL